MRIAWNIPGDMLNGAIALQILQRVSPSAIPRIRSVLENHRWFADRWRDDLTKLPESERDEILFMLAARWADDIRTEAKLQREIAWHFINWPFKPEGEPESVKVIPPRPDNILSAIADDKRILQSGASAEQKATALAWLFHLVGDIHQPLHTIQLFSREYPNGDRGGNVRVAQGRGALPLHRLWDGLITSRNNTRILINMAVDLRSRFPGNGLTELASADPEIWAKESYEIAAKIAYQNGALRGTAKPKQRDCREVTDAVVLPNGYAAIARKIADRRMILAGYRLANLLQQLLANSVP